MAFRPRSCREWNSSSYSGDGEGSGLVRTGQLNFQSGSGRWADFGPVLRGFGFELRFRTGSSILPGSSSLITSIFLILQQLACQMTTIPLLHLPPPHPWILTEVGLIQFIINFSRIFFFGDWQGIDATGIGPKAVRARSSCPDLPQDLLLFALTTPI